MSKILIIGNTTSAVAAVEYIRAQDSSVEITLFCPEGLLPYNRSLLPALVARDIKEPHIFVHSDKFFKGNNVNVITGEELARVSLKRKHITTDKKTQIAFDKVLFTDAPAYKVPSIKGHQKEGVFDALLLKSTKALIKALPYVDNIIVSVTNLAGFNMACALSRLGKQVMVVSKTSSVLDGIFDEETGALLKQVAEARNLRVIINETVDEILGDAEVKAVRLSSGKVIAAEAVIFDEISSDLRAFNDSELLEGESVKVDQFFNSKLSDVSACDGILGSLDISAAMSHEIGRCAAANLLVPGSLDFQAPHDLRMFGEKVCDGFFGGTVHLVEGGRELMKFDGPQNIYKKIYLLNGRLVGAVWFNALNDKDKVQQALVEEMSLAGQEDQFLHS